MSGIEQFESNCMLITSDEMKDYLVYKLQHNYCVILAPNDFMIQLENTVYADKENKYFEIVGNILNPIYVCKKTKKFIKFFKKNGVLPNTMLMILVAVLTTDKTRECVFDIRDQRQDISDDVKLKTLNLMVDSLIKYTTGDSYVQT